MDGNIERVAIWPENDIGIERYISQKERDTMPDSDFGWPEEQKYPIPDQAHLDAAVKLLGHAPEDKQASIKRRIVSIAKRKNLKLPESWGGEDDKEDDGERAAMPEHAMLYAPITRIDDQKWEVEGIATSEAVDSFGTIFSYEASKKAFKQWIERTANVREMHDRKAVGKGVGVQFDDANKQVLVRLRVSKGAPDTWTKIQENVLSGLSVGGKPHVWESIERNGKSYPYLTSYELTELSLVDNASNPDGHGLTICRADGLTELIDTTEPEEQPAPTPEPVIPVPEPEAVERAGARVSSATRAQLHGTIKSLQETCSCADCQSALGGDDADSEQDNSKDTAERIAEIVLARMVQELHTPIQRMHAIAGTFARSHAPDIDISPLKQSLEDIVNRLATVPTQSSLDEVRTSLEVVKGQVERIAAQPAPGGPILNGARPVEKTLGPSHMSPPPQDTYTILERLQAAGVLDTQDKQVAAAALAVVPTRGRIG